MRVVVTTLAFVSLIACTKANPEVCCVSEAQCAAIGVEQPRLCEAGQACKAHSCVASECDTSLDCTSPDNPICSNNLCVGSCTIDDDCADVPGRTHCSSAGSCVGCRDSLDCPDTAAICDVQTQACRGCALDDECGSGVCIEANAECAEASAVVFVSSIGQDVGTCTATAPCASLTYALARVNTSRPIIHITGAQIAADVTVTIDKPVIIDGTGNRILRMTTGPVFALTGYSPFVSIEHISIINSTAGTPSITVESGSTLRLVDCTLDQADIQGMTSTLELRSSRVKDTTAIWSGGTVTISDTDFDSSKLSLTNCQATVERNRFLPAIDGAVQATGGLVRMENNLFVTASEFTDLLLLKSHAPGTRVAFNTIVNTSSVTQSPVAIDCDATVKVTSNIFAYNSTNPVANCAATSSLFDVPGAPDAVGNTFADANTFFVNRAAGDYHLSAQSPAKGIGESGLVTTDLEGNTRPTSQPDVGALEAP